jgi:hypothetical protein
VQGTFGTPVRGTSNRNAKDRVPGKKAPARKFGVRQIGGKPLEGFCPPELRGPQVWLRAELLQGLSAHIQSDRTSLRIHGGKHPRGIDGRSLGARWEGYGWWVPLRKTADTLGWRVAWDAKKREAVVHTAPAVAAR